MLNEYIPRKILHAVIGTALVVLVILCTRLWSLQTTLYLGVAGLLTLIIIDLVRIERNQYIPIYANLLKAKERDRFHALIYSVTAAIIVLAVFDFRIAIAALLMAVLGDPIASIVGRKYGRFRMRTKTVEGTAVNAIVASIIGIVVLRHFGAIGILIGLLMGITATIVEFFSDKTEDNFTIPLFAAAVGQFLFWLF